MIWFCPTCWVDVDSRFCPMCGKSHEAVEFIWEMDDETLAEVYRLSAPTAAPAPMPAPGAAAPNRPATLYGILSIAAGFALFVAITMMIQA